MRLNPRRIRCGARAKCLHDTSCQVRSRVADVGRSSPLSERASSVHRQPISNGGTTTSQLADGLQNRWRRPVRRTDLVNLFQLSIPALESPRAKNRCNPCASRQVSKEFSWPRWTLAICRLPSLKRHGCHLGLIQNVCLKPLPTSSRQGCVKVLSRSDCLVLT